MGFIDKIKNMIPQKTQVVSGCQLIQDKGNSFYSWNGKIYQSDILRSCITPRATAIGKLVAKHIRNNSQEGIVINPEPYIRFLLEEPNPYMTGQMLLEKMINQLELNNNAFALINRDEFGYPCEIYPIPATSAEAIYDKNGVLYLRFTLRNMKIVTFAYSDVIHLRQDFNENDIFGTSRAEALTPLMEIVTTTDQGIVKAIRNSSAIKWLLLFKQSLRPEDLKKATKEFVDNYLSIDSETGGAAAADVRISYFEAKIEPIAIQLSNEYTRKIFSRRERGFGNKIIFEAANLQYASMNTKLQLVQMVDRGALTPNEWREVFNLAPIKGGDEPIRRLDTAVVTKGGD